MKTSPLISIVCPVYNVQSYVQRCIDSILCQTFREWELILIDDGSTDNSSKICDSYAAMDRRIKVIHKINEGVSATRQLGNDLAEGKFVIHVDPDDYIEPNMLDELYGKAILSNADVVISDFYVNEISGNEYIVKQSIVMNQPEAVLRALFYQLHGSCWNKLVRRDCYVKYNVKFPIGVNYCEDVLFWVQLFQHSAIKITFLPKALYHYVMHENSITHKYSRRTFEDRITYIKILMRYLPIDKYRKEIRKAKLDVYFEAYMHDVLSKGEAWKLLLSNRRAAFCECKSLRYRLGYFALLIGCFSLSKKLLKY